MPKSKIIYQASQEVIGKHLQSNEWIIYSGELKIYDRKINPIELKLTSEIYDTFIGGFMDKKKENIASKVIPPVFMTVVIVGAVWYLLKK